MKNPTIETVAKFIATMSYKDMMEFAASLPEISSYRSPAQRAESLSDWSSEYLAPSLLPPTPNIGVCLAVANADVETPL